MRTGCNLAFLSKDLQWWRRNYFPGIKPANENCQERHGTADQEQLTPRNA